MLEETDFQLTYNCLFSYNYYYKQTQTSENFTIAFQGCAPLLLW